MGKGLYMTYVTCDVCDDISGLIQTGSMLIVVTVEYAMGIILVTDTIYYENLMSSSSKNEIFFPNSVFSHCYC